MANENMKNETVNNENEVKEQETNQATATTEEPKKDGILKKTGNFFRKNGKKIGVGIGIAAAFAAGIAADKIGIKLPGKKDSGEDQETAE